MWDLPGPGLESMSPALAGGFLTTAPPGKSQFFFLFLLLEEFVFMMISVVSECDIEGKRNFTLEV